MCISFVVIRICRGITFAAGTLLTFPKGHASEIRPSSAVTPATEITRISVRDTLDVLHYFRTEILLFTRNANFKDRIKIANRISLEAKAFAVSSLDSKPAPYSPYK